MLFLNSNRHDRKQLLNSELDDLTEFGFVFDVIIKFQDEGFIYDIKTFKGKYEENALCIYFYFVSQENGYI